MYLLYKTKISLSGAEVTKGSHDTLGMTFDYMCDITCLFCKQYLTRLPFSIDKAKVGRKALSDVSNTRGQSSRFDKPSGLR